MYIYIYIYVHVLSKLHIVHVVYLLCLADFSATSLTVFLLGAPDSFPATHIRRAGWCFTSFTTEKAPS